MSCGEFSVFVMFMVSCQQTGNKNTRNCPDNLLLRRLFVFKEEAYTQVTVLTSGSINKTSGYDSMPHAQHSYT